MPHDARVGAACDQYPPPPPPPEWLPWWLLTATPTAMAPTAIPTMIQVFFAAL
jgi:hypothetical protein